MIDFTALHIDSPLSYVVAVVIPALDAVLPILPSEAAIVTLGVATAGSGDPRIAVLVALAATGAFLGDNLSYALGRRFAPWARRRFFSSLKGKARHAWAERALERYGMRLVLVCRFIPGGRSAVTLTCGIVDYDRRRFVAATAVAGVLWASYAFFIGRVGGRAFADRPWVGLLVALGIAFGVSVLIDVARRIAARVRGRRARSPRQ